MSKLKRFPKYEELYPQGILKLDTYNLQAIKNLVTVVVNKYFSMYNDNSEFISLGMAKCVEVLQENKFDHEKYPSKNALKNFLFTSTRNAISNQIYHQYNPDKEILSDVIPDINAYEGDTQLISIEKLQEYIKSSDFNIDLRQFYTYLVYLGYPLERHKELRVDIDTIDRYFYNKMTCFFIHSYFKNLI